MTSYLRETRKRYDSVLGLDYFYDPTVN